MIFNSTWMHKMFRFKWFVLTIFGFFFLVYSCKSNKIESEYPITEFHFDSIFGFKSSDSLNRVVNFSQLDKMYSLLGQGFFKTPKSDHTNELIQDWLSEHPDAKLIPVAILKSKPNIIYCWIQDGDENLNIFLVENGCFPGGTMQRIKLWNEMDKVEKKNFRGTEKPKIRVLVDDSIYDSFIEKIKVAELYARENEIGIWNENKED